MRKYYFALVIASLLCALSASAANAQEIRRPFYKERAFWINAAASTADFALSKAVVDGRSIREGNPLARTKDGRLSTGKGLALTGISIALPALVHHFNPKAGRHLMWTFTLVHSIGIGAGIAVRF